MLETLNILAVDDEPGMRMGVARVLDDFVLELPGAPKPTRFKVRAAATGREALEALSAELPHIMLLDYKLPDMLGLEILTKLSSEQSDILTIVMTAYASLEVAVSATKIGAYDFLAKPFSPAELQSAVSKAAKHIFMRERARLLDEEKKQIRFQFISVLAHELKSPINAVEGYLYLMRDKTMGQELSAYSKMIEKSVERIDGMRKLIYDLLDLTRIESGQLNRQPVAVNLLESAGRLADGIKAEAEKRGITVSLDIAPDLTFYADQTEIEMIFNNLLTTGVKYNRDGGRLTLTGSKQNGILTIVCSDTGIGMSQEETARLFQEFTRIKNKKTKNILGSGLGLTIMKKTVAAYDGTIQVESEPDVGTTFTLTLRETTSGTAA